MLELIDGMDDLDDFLAALTPETPRVVWEAFTEVRAEIPAALPTRLAERATECGRVAAAQVLRG
ncbi:hypothetical protein ACLMAL_22940 [Nocardia sp. CWNU-33]|uniref:hypothetical protein n=1 Tax=Nocardia sp. CWNU-33 TaxID=3392117 RepID=UPI00398E93AE